MTGARSDVTSYLSWIHSLLGSGELQSPFPLGSLPKPKLCMDIFSDREHLTDSDWSARQAVTCLELSSLAPSTSVAQPTTNKRDRSSLGMRKSC